jgi:hypothetical protein
MAISLGDVDHPIPRMLEREQLVEHVGSLVEIDLQPAPNILRR